MSSIDLIRGFQTLGCHNELKCAVASIVYLDLREDDKISSLEQFYDKELDLIYFRVQKEDDEFKTILPASSCDELDMNKVAQIQRKLNSESNNITIAISDPNSTILYYNVTNDFVEKL